MTATAPLSLGDLVASIIRFSNANPCPIENSVVYFARLREYPKSHIKIGHTSDLISRMSALSWDLSQEIGLVRVDCLASLPGGVELEGHIHTLFSEWEDRREWFAQNPALLELIEVLRTARANRNAIGMQAVSR